MSRSRRWLLTAVGVGLVLGLGAMADPAAVVHRLRSVPPPSLALALAWSAVIATARAARLRLLVGEPLTPVRAFGVVAVTQAAIGVLPFRLGELALIVLLGRAGVPGTVRGLTFLVVLRALDLGALLTWAAALAVLTGAHMGGGVLFLTVTVVLALAAGFAAVRLIGPAARDWRRRPGWRRRAIRQLLMVRRELLRRARSPLRVTSLVLLSLFIWAGIWGQTVALVRGMGLDWPARAVLGGVVGSAVSSALPITTVGSFGTLEAGWALALAAAGIGAVEALAVGFATHMWSVVFAILLGLVGWPAIGWRTALPASAASPRVRPPTT